MICLPDSAHILTRPAEIAPLLAAANIDPQDIRGRLRFIHADLYAMALWTETGLIMVVLPKATFNAVQALEVFESTVEADPALN